MFEFSSGGESFPEGYGSWNVKLDSKNFSIKHIVFGKSKDYGNFLLNDEESSKLSALIKSAKIPPSTRPGYPDEPCFVFAIEGKKNEVWAGIARDNPTITSLIEYIGTLIEKYTKQKPILW